MEGAGAEFGGGVKALASWGRCVRYGGRRSGQQRQGEAEARALAGPGLGLQHAGVTLDDTLHDRQPDAGAGKLALRVHALEGHEQPGGVLHVEARAVVAHEILPQHARAEGIDDFPAAEFDARPRHARGELAGVVEQVGERDPEQAAVAPDRQPGGDHELDVAPRPALAHVLGHLAGEQVELQPLEGRLAAGDAGQLQQVLDEQVHARAFAADACEVFLRFHGQGGAVILLERLRPAADAAQRCAQVVRHRVAEALQLAVGEFELAALLVQGLQGLAERVGHMVELRTDLGDLVLAGHAEAVLVVTLLDRPRALVQFLQRIEDAAMHQEELQADHQAQCEDEAGDQALLIGMQPFQPGLAEIEQAQGVAGHLLRRLHEVHRGHALRVEQLGRRRAARGLAQAIGGECLEQRRQFRVACAQARDDRLAGGAVHQRGREQRAERLVALVPARARGRRGLGEELEDARAHLRGAHRPDLRRHAAALQFGAQGQVVRDPQPRGDHDGDQRRDRDRPLLPADQHANPSVSMSLLLLSD